MKFGVALALSCLLATAWAKPISKLILFGDSLSDNGNGYEYTHHRTPAAPWYYLGRYSNGPIWVDHIIENLFSKKRDRILNYAFGGAGALKTQGCSFTLSQEIDSYLLGHATQADSDALFVIWIGANDYLFRPQADESNIHQVVGEIERNIHRLITHGARHIMLISLPNLGDSPFARAVDLTQTFSNISHVHNDELKHMIRKMKNLYSDIHWMYFDMMPLWQQAMQKSSAFGPEHVHEACVQFIPTNNTESPINREFSTQCQGYMFFDQLHPTTWVHAILAKSILKYLQLSYYNWRE